ncbi:beta-1,3-N-acetylglucosaminyltransferase radical fringe-like [Anneissia japonica]|uniref:beta-1,3-N-acetylglucosaminyltransferase radical fringe-like n=1 Tax=Anneissia japonica TaxID=1529436 RepID=UPI001425B15D|nr:beta-1,3-N-acetylglucosaminyltransferase radical fringe-like [Anneissia japonica]
MFKMRVSVKKTVQWSFVLTTLYIASVHFFSKRSILSDRRPSLDRGERSWDKTNDVPARSPSRKDRVIQSLSQKRNKSVGYGNQETEHNINNLISDSAFIDNEKDRLEFQRNHERLLPPPEGVKQLNPSKILSGNRTLFTANNNFRKTLLSDIFIGMKTTERYHRQRLDILLETWVKRAKEETFIFTDEEDKEYKLKAGDHLIVSNCSARHSRQALCCKMAAMYDMYLESNKRWFCHVDDDNYLNVNQLVKLLNNYKHTDDVYLGRTSLSHPIEATDRNSPDLKKVKFWFATGGAGFCLSKALALKMKTYAGGGTFKSVCNRIRLPDDVTVGFISEVLLNTKLTQVKLFNSHLQSLWNIPPEKLSQQVTLSYGDKAKHKNIIKLLDGYFNDVEDPTRLLSLHCMIFPDEDVCKRKRPS